VHGHPVLRALRAALVMPYRAHRAAFAAQLLLMVALGVAPVAAAWLLRAVLDAITDGGRTGDLPWLVVGLVAVGGTAGVLPYLEQYLTAQSGRAIERVATTELFGVVGRLAGLRRLEDPVFLDRLNMAQRVGMSGAGQVFNSAISVVQSTLTLTGFLAALLVLSPVMAVVLLVATIPWLFVEVSLARRRAAMLAGISHAERRQYFYANLLSSLAAAKEIRLFGLGLFFRRRMLDELRVIQQSGQRIDRRQTVLYGLLSTGSAVVAGAGIWWAASAAARGRLTVGDVSLFVAGLGSASAALTAMVGSAAMGYQAVLTFRSYTDILAEGPDLTVPAHPASVLPLQRGIEFDDVWFRYGPDHTWVLRGVSLFVPAGQTVALVGRNGAGKSTLVKLMCRFYDPDRGRILWDGVDLRDMDPAALRDRISAVFQDYMTYELSARENIAVGDLSLAATDEPLEAAARRAGIHDVLSALPKGYGTLLTRTYLDLADKEDPQTGVLLSGGQWQRVALARALLRGGRDLVILDEPSSGLDAEAEYEIHSSLRAHRHGRTTVLISHRLNAVREAENIVVLAEGGIAEQGDHDTLMARGGTYARLFSLQARGFADHAPGDVMSSLLGAIDHG
jgi:ATP-binding cassette, subfamily B, bacterial